MWKKVLLITVVLIGSLFVSEIALRVYFKKNRIRPIIRTQRQYKFFAFDPILGHKNAPNTEGVFFREGDFEHSVYINSLGMRASKDYKIKVIDNNLPIIAFLGDSYTWGHGVPYDNSFVGIIDKEFENKARVLNFGVSGYSPVQYYLMIDEVLKFNPKLVIIAFCLANDFIDNVKSVRYNYPRPYAELTSENKLKISGHPIKNVRDFGESTQSESIGNIFEQLTLYQLIKSAIGVNSNSRGRIKDVQGLTSLSRTDYYKDVDSLSSLQQTDLISAIYINKLLLSAIKQKVTAAGSKLIILSVASKLDYNIVAPHFFNNYSKNLLNQNRLDTTAKELNIPIIDTINTIEKEDFYENDGHWRASGHKKVSVLLKKWLNNNFVIATKDTK